MQGASRAYRYLDSEQDRRQLVEDIYYIRQAVLQMVETLPADRRYEPRYHGWSPGAMLMHLHLIDSLSLWGIQLALVGIHPPVSLAMLNRFNDLTARIFKTRLVETTMRGIRRQERRIAELILTLPLDKYSKAIYDPTSEGYTTVERALQSAFLFHWQEHWQTIQRVEGIFYEPPERFDTL